MQINLVKDLNLNLRLKLGKNYDLVNNSRDLEYLTNGIHHI